MSNDVKVDFRGETWPNAPEGYEWTGTQATCPCLEFLFVVNSDDFIVRMLDGWRAYRHGFGPASEKPIAMGPETGAEGARLALAALREHNIVP